MPRFVILQHTIASGARRGTHWDLMLEQDGELLTWALAEPPRPGSQISATKLSDHRLVYLEYEGPISGDRGEVSRVVAGEYALIRLDGSQAVFDLHGSGVDWQVDLRHQSENVWSAEFRALT